MRHCHFLNLTCDMGDPQSGAPALVSPANGIPSDAGIPIMYHYQLQRCQNQSCHHLRSNPALHTHSPTSIRQEGPFLAQNGAGFGRNSWHILSMRTETATSDTLTPALIKSPDKRAPSHSCGIASYQRTHLFSH